MSAYFPPIDNVPIFDTVLFRTPNGDNNNTLTREEADRLYLQFPNGQGTETVPGLVVSGNANVNTNLIVSGNANVNTNLDVSGNANVNTNLIVSGNANVNTNLDVSGVIYANTNVVLDGTSGTHYLQFPDNTKQYTAAASQQFQPRFINYSNTQSGGSTVGYTSGPKVTFNGTWNLLDYAIIRVNQQGSYWNDSGYDYYASTSGIMIFRPYYMGTGGWAPFNGNYQYPNNNKASVFGPAKKPLYYSSNVNQGEVKYFVISGYDKVIEFLFYKSSTDWNSWSTTIQLEYICRSPSGGQVVFSNGDSPGTQTYNSLP
jgi:hypothetical protein